MAPALHGSGRRLSVPRRPGHGRSHWFASIALCGAAACGFASLEALPLAVSIQASRPAVARGDTINFVVEAQGRSLIGLAIEFGDGTNELYGSSGARTARVLFRHVYATRGAYVVEVTATDAAAGTKTATVQIRVD